MWYFPSKPCFCGGSVGWHVSYFTNTSFCGSSHQKPTQPWYSWDPGQLSSWEGSSFCRKSRHAVYISSHLYCGSHQRMISVFITATVTHASHYCEIRCVIIYIFFYIENKSDKQVYTVLNISLWTSGIFADTYFYEETICPASHNLSGVTNSIVAGRLNWGKLRLHIVSAKLSSRIKSIIRVKASLLNACCWMCPNSNRYMKAVVCNEENLSMNEDTFHPTYLK